jgi:hypothetical protein
MNQTQQLTAVYNTVKVTDEQSTRADAVGVYLGVSGTQYIVKFDDGKTELFNADQLQVL